MRLALLSFPSSVLPTYFQIPALHQPGLHVRPSFQISSFMPDSDTQAAFENSKLNIDTAISSTSAAGATKNFRFRFEGGQHTAPRLHSCAFRAVTRGPPLHSRLFRQPRRFPGKAARRHRHYAQEPSPSPCPLPSSLHSFTPIRAPRSVSSNLDSYQHQHLNAERLHPTSSS